MNPRLGALENKNCHVCERENKDRSALRAKPEQMGGKQEGTWMVMVGKGETEGRHLKDARSSRHLCVSEGVFARGLAHDMKMIVDEALPSGIRKERPADACLDQVHQFLLHAVQIDRQRRREVRVFQTSTSKLSKERKQEERSATCREPFARELCQKHALCTPCGCTPCNNCESAEQLVQALGTSDASASLLTHLGSGRPFELCKAHEEKESKERTKQEGLAALHELLGALVARSPVTLHELSEGRGGPKGARFRGHDGTSGRVAGQQLIPNTLHELRHPDDQGKPALQLRRTG